jgi:hypothetical protein
MEQPKTKLIEYRGEKILYTAGMYWVYGIPHRTEKKAKTAIDGLILNRQ